MELSYLAQVNRLRALARTALAQFPLRNAALHFIQHGENTTFRVRAGGRSYLLRVHRAGYHSPAALGEELAWLTRLSDVPSLAAPVPVRAQSGEFLVKATAPGMGARWCDLLEWVDGAFLRKRRPPFRIFELGALMARLHRHARGQPCRHRRYWSAEGLLGSAATFGAIGDLPGISRKQQARISEERRTAFARLRAFEERFPSRSSLVHADLHFGNFVILPEGGVGAIDFDDCGFGFHAYDLAVPLSVLEEILCQRDEGNYLLLHEALQAGYASETTWDSHDETILPWLITARRLLMLGWLQSRRDNPRIHHALPGAVKRVLAHLERSAPLRR